MKSILSRMFISVWITNAAYFPHEFACTQVDKTKLQIDETLPLYALADYEGKLMPNLKMMYSWGKKL
ncbi:hypothetical protein [Paenibacillus radicis (ex Xue et al. 2023)]|uniref:Uncharacterized protein n=1 Tax=Paenibacillus radicis (ex Xue et al. 2023) TaxID=2972489 RepID=A0ABT1YHD2_9BACL|nr:hypothetical protein [Paenibacillus radicis (ex Xue et al. 2023)]MCR8632614.1 hypothetical protein [Paenibacillus radicis (ex Xue et al. 2023)]